MHAESSTRTARAEPTHLLVVEDEPTIRKLFSSLLENAGFSVAQAEDGFSALEEVRRKRPALILSDLNMPRMTGFELLSIVRRRFPEIHVIAMSGAFQGDNVPDGVAADAFYEKSGRHIATLVEIIDSLLEARGHSSGEGRAAAEEVTHLSEVALWVTQRGASLAQPYILLSCQECLRSFPHCVDEEKHNPAMQVQVVPCVFCEVPIRYALLDPSLTHHSGYAPSETGSERSVQAK